MICNYGLKIGKRMVGIDTAMNKTKAMAKALMFFMDEYIGNVSSVLDNIIKEKREYDEVVHLDLLRTNFVKNVLNLLKQDFSFSISNETIQLDSKTSVGFDVKLLDTRAADKYLKYRLNHICDEVCDVHTTYVMESLPAKHGWELYRVQLSFQFDV